MIHAVQHEVQAAISTDMCICFAGCRLEMSALAQDSAGQRYGASNDETLDAKAKLNRARPEKKEEKIMIEEVL